MAELSDQPIHTLEDLARFEAAMTLQERLPERSVLDVFIGTAARDPDRTAVTMLMTGAPDEQPRQVSYRDLLGLVRRAANAFHALADRAPASPTCCRTLSRLMPPCGGPRPPATPCRSTSFCNRTT